MSVNNKIKSSSGKIIFNEAVAEKIWLLKLFMEDWDEYCRPGTFVEIKLNNNAYILRRPISICNWEATTGELTLIYKTVGNGTEELSTYKAGTKLEVLGPLGNGYPVHVNLANENSQKCLLIGGGVGVPPLYELAKHLRKNNHKVTFLLGFQTAKDVFLAEELKQYGEVFISTDDGSLGFKGRVDAYLPNFKNIDVYYACGPLPLLVQVEKKLAGIEGYLSYEARMACGIGACYGCCVDTVSGLQRVCKDGPVFPSGTVIHGGI